VHHWAGTGTDPFIKGQIISPCIYDILDKIRNRRVSIVQVTFLKRCMEEGKRSVVSRLQWLELIIVRCMAYAHVQDGLHSANLSHKKADMQTKSWIN
jgi:hypothetical protein